MNRRTFISSIFATLSLSWSPRYSVLAASPEIKNIKKTGIVTDPIFLQHHISPDHPESPDRMRFVQNAIKRSGLLDELLTIDLKPEVKSWIKAIHSDAHIKAIMQNTPIAHQVAEAGVRACLAAVDKVVSKEVRNAFCATRPPGHHALNTGREEGFCYYNNIAIAARYAQQKYDLKKILIVDWDYHHGNATEAMFYHDPSVLFFSTHDQFAYPGTGNPAKKGEGKGLGYNINVHLPCGTNDEKIIDAFNKKLLPVLDSFEPEMVLVSAGFDSRIDDLLGCFEITDVGFIALTKIVMHIADKYCDGRLVSILEGGYNLRGNASAVVAHLNTLQS